MSKEQEIKLREVISKLIRQQLSEEELDETSTCAGAGAFLTPNAFSANKKPNKNYDPNYTEVDNDYNENELNEGIDITTGIPEKPISPQRQLGTYVREVNLKLDEINNLITKTLKFKTEVGLGKDDYWKRTNNALYKINEKLIKISGRIKDIG